MAKKNDTIFFENKLLDFVTAKDPMFEMLQPFPLCQDRCPSVRQFAVICSWLSDGYVPAGSHYLSFGHVPVATTSLCPSASFRLRCCWINCSTSSSRAAAIIFLADSLTIFSSQSTASTVFFSSFLLIIVFIGIVPFLLFFVVIKL